MGFSKLLAGAAALSLVANAPLSSAEVITDDSHFFGQSPPVYPAPKASGLGDWEDAYNKAKSLVDKMTLKEKLGFSTGVSSNTSCVGTLPAVERLGFPGICVSDAGNGLRGEELVSSWPSGVHVGASWNRELANSRGQGVGGEYKAKGVNVLLGPVLGPLGRVVSSGRNWEGFAADPYLTGALGFETIDGLQSVGVGASTKHYIGNEQETNRVPLTDDDGKNISAVSSNIDDKTMHELYLWPFQDAVLAGASNIMCSYQRLNNSYGCQNSKTLNGLLKTELGFQGFVVTDWGALHGGADTILAGLDVAMPDDGGYWGDKLVEAVKNGTLPESRVDDLAIRVLSHWYKLGQDKLFPTPGKGMTADKTAPHSIIDARDPNFKSTLRDGAVEGHVLVKNEGALPLKKPKLLSVFGFSARSADSNSLDSIWSLGYASYNLSGVTQGLPESSYFPNAINGTLYSGGGSGANAQSLVMSPMDAIMQQCWDDDTGVFWDFSTSEPTVSGASDACLVITNTYASEGFDRPALESDYSNTLIKNVASSCTNTIVIIHNAGPSTVSSDWISNENVTAVVYAHLPGQHSGRALVDLLYGRENFSGKLPYTVAKNESDYGSLLKPDRPESGEYELFPQSDFDEGVMIDYRYFDAKDITPQYEFGYGMSYTQFSYQNLNIQQSKGNNTQLYPTKKVAVGGQKDLWDVLVTVKADVSNTGDMKGQEVAQLYLAMPDAGKDGAPVKQLRGFGKKMIQVGDTKTFTFELNRRDLSTWDVEAQKWRLNRGTYKVMVGSSSRKLPLKGSFEIN